MKKKTFLFFLLFGFLSLSAQERKIPFLERKNISAYANWKQHQNLVLSQQKNIPGWCPSEKAIRMMNLIYQIKPQICVEIGVFGGSSIYPTASALKFLGQGKVYAIDPWENSHCLEGYTPDNIHYQWWSSIDLEKIYIGFLNMLEEFKIRDHCVPMKMTALKALSHFADGSIDILHIDGNHTEENAFQDAQNYLPKVKPGGYIWFDDINWSTTRKAWEFLNSECKAIESLSTNEYVLFQKS